MTTRFTDNLLRIEPSEEQVELRSEPGEPISGYFLLKNITDGGVIFKVTTTNPQKYWVSPEYGGLYRGSPTTPVRGEQAPADMQFRDIVIIESAKSTFVPPLALIEKDFIGSRVWGKTKEHKLQMVYAAPPQRPSQAPDGSEEGSSSRGSVSDGGNFNNLEGPLRRPGIRSQEGGFSSTNALICGFLGFILGRLTKHDESSYTEVIGFFTSVIIGLILGHLKQMRGE